MYNGLARLQFESYLYLLLTGQIACQKEISCLNICLCVLGNVEAKIKLTDVKLIKTDLTQNKLLHILKLCHKKNCFDEYTSCYE